MAAAAQMFKKVLLGPRRAYQVLDASLSEAAISYVPDFLRWRPYTEMSEVHERGIHRQDPATIRLLLLPQGERVLLVLCRVDGKKMCLLVAEKETLLLSLKLEDAEVFGGTVFECFLVPQQDELKKHQLYIMDVFVFKGVAFNDMLFDTRRIMAYVFTTFVLQPRDKDAVEIGVLDTHPMDNFDILRLLSPVLVLNATHTFQREAETQSLLLTRGPGGGGRALLEL